jgi:hypothetical protein
MGQTNSDWLNFFFLNFFKILIYFLKVNAKFVNHGPKKLGLVNLFYILFFFYDPCNLTRWNEENEKCGERRKGTKLKKKKKRKTLNQ